MLICDPKGGDPSKWLGECSAGLYNIETGVRRDVTTELTWLGSHPAISPDGRYVAADNAGHSYPGAVVIVSVDGSAPGLRVLCYHHASWESGHITHPTVHRSPNCTRLLFISDKDSPRPNLQGVKLDRTGVFEEVGVVPVIDTILIGEHIDAKATTLTVETTEDFSSSGRLLIAGNRISATLEARK